jgi:hypothetical protein
MAIGVPHPSICAAACVLAVFAQKQQLSLKPQVGQMLALPPFRSGIGEPQTGQGISSAASSRGTGTALRSSALVSMAGLAGSLDMAFLPFAGALPLVHPPPLYPSYTLPNTSAPCWRPVIWAWYNLLTTT